MSNRNPILDPRPGDIIKQHDGKEALIMNVTDRAVFWNIYDESGKLICLFDAPHDEWKKSNEHLRVVHLRANEFKVVRDE
jgi:hypothetical protein